MSRRSPFTPSLFIVDDIPTRQLRADFKKAAAHHAKRFVNRIWAPSANPRWWNPVWEASRARQLVEILFRKGL